MVMSSSTRGASVSGRFGLGRFGLGLVGPLGLLAMSLATGCASTSEVSANGTSAISGTNPDEEGPLDTFAPGTYENADTVIRIDGSGTHEVVSLLTMGAHATKCNGDLVVTGDSSAHLEDKASMCKLDFSHNDTDVGLDIRGTTGMHGTSGIVVEPTYYTLKGRPTDAVVDVYREPGGKQIEIHTSSDSSLAVSVKDSDGSVLVSHGQAKHVDGTVDDYFMSAIPECPVAVSVVRKDGKYQIYVSASSDPQLGATVKAGTSCPLGIYE
jgi:hypothetical protein